MSLAEKVPLSLKGYLKQPVAVLGFGAGGRGVQSIFEKLKCEVVCYDEKAGEDSEVRREFGPAEASRYGLVIYSPAFLPDHPWLVTARESDCKCLNELAFSSMLRSGPMILVTGTNGGSTLSEFITFAFKRHGTLAISAGENQHPLAKLAIKQDQDGVTAVCQIGAITAKYIEKLEYDTLFWTNIHEDQLKIFGDLKNLFLAHFRLIELCPKADFYVGSTVAARAEEFGIELPEKAKVIKAGDFEDWDLDSDSAFRTSFNRDSLYLLRAYWADKEWPETVLKSAANQFEERAHRLHVSGIVRQIPFWNDSKSTNFAAATAAIDYFDEPVLWISGGRYDGGDLEKFSDQIQDGVGFAIFYAEVGKEMAKIWDKRKKSFEYVEDLKDAVELAYDKAGETQPVVFSPGFHSGKKFSDFIERGICFDNAVLGLRHRYGTV